MDIFDKFNIFDSFSNRKPNIEPPSSLPEPERGDLDPIIEKYKPLIDSQFDPPWRPLPGWVQFKKAMDDVLFLNFKSISNYMENEVYKRISKQEFEATVKDASTAAASCGWMIGREWAIRDLDLHSSLGPKNYLSVDDIPADALKLLLKAAYFPYWLFASIFTEYYKSSFGERTRDQKDAHLKDTYQSLVEGVFLSFLEGVRLNIKF